MKAIKQYVKHFIKLKALQEVCSDLKDEVLRELKRNGGKAALNGVELHTTNKTTRRYPKDIQDILKDLQSQIEQQKKVAEESGKVNITTTETFDAAIPKSAEKEVLSEVSEYRKHFGL